MTLQQQIRSARTRTLVVMILFFALMAVIVAGVYVFFGSGFGLLMLLVAVGYGFFGYIAAGSIVAATAGAHKITKADAPELWNTVENAAIATASSLAASSRKPSSNQPKRGASRSLPW